MSNLRWAWWGQADRAHRDYGKTPGSPQIWETVTVSVWEVSVDWMFLHSWTFRWQPVLKLPRSTLGAPQDNRWYLFKWSNLCGIAGWGGDFPSSCVSSPHLRPPAVWSCSVGVRSTLTINPLSTTFLGRENPDGEQVPRENLTSSQQSARWARWRCQHWSRTKALRHKPVCWQPPSIMYEQKCISKCTQPHHWAR